MADSFLDDPLNRVVLEGIADANKLIQAHSLILARYAYKTKNLYLLDGTDPGAFLIACDSRNDSIIRQVSLGLRIVSKSFKLLNRRDFKRLSTNHKATHDIVDAMWYRRYVRGRFFRIRIAAADRSIRDTGAFRRLLTPIIEVCNKDRIPIVIETHNPDNVGLYSHFGFKLVKTISSPRINIEQFCIIRPPVFKA
ncbi:MAG TPA: hypothetical protein DCE14_03810 [Kosmotogaceae bacterium]|nr:hypothetical protein [Kosmotogaceae bacterium]